MEREQQPRALKLQLKLMEVEVENLKVLLDLVKDSGRQREIDLYLDKLSEAKSRINALKKMLRNLNQQR